MVYDGLRYKDKILIVGVIIFQLILCVLMGTQKKNFFCDEIYSYGLANSEAYTFIDPETAKQYAETGWVGVCQVKCVSFIKFSYRQFSKAAGFTWQN
ncbi:MAG: hypothetical protein HFH75_15040 [Lachnospiraceae bacterium]|jgi:hypothetical protein|nr:hypothetical protein [Lachnospiraceae bacterium]